MAYFLSGDYDRAIADFAAWYEDEPLPSDSAIWLGVAQAQAGNLAKARQVFDEYRSRSGQLGSDAAPQVIYLQAYSYYYPFKMDKHRELFLDGLRKLGVPDANE